MTRICDTFKCYIKDMADMTRICDTFKCYIKDMADIIRICNTFKYSCITIIHVAFFKGLVKIDGM